MIRMILYEKFEKESVKDYGYRVVRDNIMSLDLTPGELLSETELANQLNISRTPIREIIGRLRARKLIDVKPQIGTFVSLIDWQLVGDAIFVRCNLERAALKQACKSFQEEDLIAMEECLAKQQSIAAIKHNVLEFHELDTQFHRLLFKGIRKDSVWEMISNMSLHYSRMRLLAEKNLNKEFIVCEHHKYLEIIKEKRKDWIEDAVNTHVEEQYTAWRALIDQNSDIAQYVKNLD